jgi:hypothetical protein
LIIIIICEGFVAPVGPIILAVLILILILICNISQGCAAAHNTIYYYYYYVIIPLFQLNNTIVVGQLQLVIIVSLKTIATSYYCGSPKLLQ